MSKPTKYYSSIQENAIAKFLGWKVVSGSGARDLSPGDIIGESFLGECKTHTRPIYKVVFFADVWKKICEEASSRFKYPALFVDDGTQYIENTWVVTFPHCINTTKCAKYKLPVSVDVNISFDPEYLASIVNYINSNHNTFTAFCAQFADTDVVIMRLLDFREVMN